MGIPRTVAQESRDAYHNRTSSAMHALRMKILGMIAAKECDGMTCDEIEDALGGCHQGISPRLTELRKEGLIFIHNSQRRATRNYHMARVYVSDEKWVNKVNPKYLVRGRRS